MPDNYAEDVSIQALARTLEGRTIVTAGVKETSSRAVLELRLDDNRLVEVGVYGNLHDEAYFVFEGVS